MLDKLTYGQQVEFLPAHITGVINHTYSDGMAGVLKTPAGSRFTVFACECSEVGTPTDELEALLAETNIPFNWSNRVIGGRK